MKRKMASIMILALLNLWIPFASAEISQELDPMVSPQADASVMGESSVDSMDPTQTSPAVSAPEAAKEEKKVEKKKEKSKKSSAKKSSEKKKKKSSSKSSKSSKNSKKSKRSSN